MLPNHPNQLLQTTLDKLSQELHNKLDTHLGQMKQVQQTLINDTLSQLIPTLLTKLTPIIEQEVQKQNQPMLNKVATCLNELQITNQQQLKMLKLGREEYQLLQTKIKSALSQLESIPMGDDSDVEKSFTTLQTSITNLQKQVSNLATSQQAMTNKQTDLLALIGELEKLKTDMTMTLSSLKQQQTTLVQSLAQFQPLLTR